MFGICLGRAQFMKSTLNRGTMEGRIAACLVFEQERLKSAVRLEAVRPLLLMAATRPAAYKGRCCRRGARSRPGSNFLFPVSGLCRS